MNEMSKLLLLDLKKAIAGRGRETVNDACRKLVESRAHIDGQWKAVSDILQFNGEFELADKALSLWEEASADNFQVEYLRAVIAASAGWTDAAMRRADSLIRKGRHHAADDYLKASRFIEQGRFEQGKELLRSLVAGGNVSGQTYLMLAMAGRVSENDGRLIVDAQKRMENAPKPEQSAYLYALGKFLLEQENFDAALDALKAGSALKQQEIKYDGAADLKSAKQSIEGWDLNVEEQTAAGDFSHPVFVTGLPRSGTTLVQQILLAHSIFGDGREFGKFEIIERDIGGKGGFAFSKYCASGKGVDTVRNLYNHLVHQHRLVDGVFVDKTLTLSRYLGLALTLFPTSPIIWVRRNPVECAWSAYRTFFSRGVSWSWSLDDIAHHFRVEDYLFDYWTERLGDRIFVLRYEDLVRDPEATISRAMQYCGLSLEPAQLHPERSSKSVQTASVAQVRRPINADSTSMHPDLSAFMNRFSRQYFG